MVGSKLVSKLVSRTLEKYFSWLKNFMATKIKMVGSRFLWRTKRKMVGAELVSKLVSRTLEKYFSWLKNFMEKKCWNHFHKQIHRISTNQKLSTLTKRIQEQIKSADVKHLLSTMIFCCQHWFLVCFLGVFALTNKYKCPSTNKNVHRSTIFNVHRFTKCPSTNKNVHHIKKSECPSKCPWKTKPMVYKVLWEIYRKRVRYLVS